MRTAAICPTCATYENALCTIYNGPYLSCIGVSPLDNLQKVIELINGAVCLNNSQITTLQGNITTINNTITNLDLQAVTDAGNTTDNDIYVNSVYYHDIAGAVGDYGRLLLNDYAWKFYDRDGVIRATLAEGAIALKNKVSGFEFTIDGSDLTSNKVFEMPNFTGAATPRTIPISVNGITAGTDGNITLPVSYKVYSALLTQSGGSAPTALVLEDTIGGITFSYTGPGQYRVNGVFPANKTIITGNNVCPANDETIAYSLGNTSYCNITTRLNGAVTNDILALNFIEIRVYP